MTSRPREPRVERVRIPDAERQALTAAVMARTSGSACERARATIAGRPEQPLSGATAALLDGHLEHCEACRAFEVTIRETRVALAAMAEIQPGQAFAEAVLAETSGRRKWSAARGRRGERFAWEAREEWRLWASAAWQRLLARPRLSFELAYVATVLVVVLVGNPALIAERMGARPAAVAGQTSQIGVGPAGATVRPGVQPGGEASIPQWMEPAKRGLQSGQAVVSRGWQWLANGVADLFTASWNWFSGLWQWLDQQLSGPPPAEPARPPVRDSQ